MTPRASSSCAALATAFAMLFSTAVAGCCVAEGTSIATPTGDKAVESLVIGDKVLTVSPDGNIELGSIVRIRPHLALSCLRLVLANGRELRLTGGHPVAVRTGWTNADKLESGQELRTPKGWLRISGVRREPGLLRVYDISVQPNGNFIAEGVVLHNKTYDPPPRPEELPGAWTGATLTKGPVYCRMVLYRDGTGLFANGPRDLYRITRWTTGRDVAPASYEFHASLVHLWGYPKYAKIKGQVSAQGILYRVSFWYPGLRGFLTREQNLEEQLQALKDVMRKYENARDQGTGKPG